MIYFISGFLLVMLLLAGVGITRGRKMRQPIWLKIWFVFSIVAAVFMAGSIFFDNIAYYHAVAGGASAFALAISYHVYGHMKERHAD